MDSFKFIQDTFLRKIPVYFKMGALLFLILILPIPITMTDELIGERRLRQTEVGNIESGFGPGTTSDAIGGGISAMAVAKIGIAGYNRLVPAPAPAAYTRAGGRAWMLSQP